MGDPLGSPRVAPLFWPPSLLRFLCSFIFFFSVYQVMLIQVAMRDPADGGLDFPVAGPAHRRERRKWSETGTKRAILGPEPGANGAKPYWPRRRALKALRVHILWAA